MATDGSTRPDTPVSFHLSQLSTMHPRQANKVLSQSLGRLVKLIRERLVWLCRLSHLPGINSLPSNIKMISFLKGWGFHVIVFSLVIRTQLSIFCGIRLSGLIVQVKWTIKIIFSFLLCRQQLSLRLHNWYHILFLFDYRFMDAQRVNGLLITPVFSMECPSESAFYKDQTACVMEW